MAGKALVVVAAMGVVVGCSSPNDELAAPEVRWAATRRNCPTYQYEIDSSSWTGFWSTTTIGISNDEVVLRSYAAGETSGADGSRTTTVMWTESGADVGSHPDGPPARTMEQLYGECHRNVLTQDPSKNDITFLADPSGALLTCVYQPHNCQDDCVIGVALSHVTLGCGGLQ